MQVAASTHKEVDAHIPNYPGLPPQLICQLHNVTMHVCYLSSSIDILMIFIQYYLFKLLNATVFENSGRCWNWWSLCSNDIATAKSSMFFGIDRSLHFFYLVLRVPNFYSLRLAIFSFSKSKRMFVYYLLNLVVLANSRLIISVKP